MSETNSVVISENDFYGIYGETDYESPMPKTSPAGYKVVQAKYMVEYHSMWLVPDNVDESLLWSKWDTLHYGTTNIQFQKIINAEIIDTDAYKYANELKICVGDTTILQEEEIYFDCEDADVDKEVLENASKAVKLFHEEPI
jgi:hypothetical protein